MPLKTTPSPNPVPRLYLATPVLGEPHAFAPSLATALETADIAAVLVRLAPADDRTLINRVKALAQPIQARGTAVLLDGYAGLVARAGADGAHATGTDAVNEALSALKPDRMVGAGGLHSRHDSMIAGEAGADYLLFGEPDRYGGRPALEAIVEQLSWWAEVFEPPCVGYAATLAEVGALAATGAEFVMLDDAVWTDPRGPKQALQDAIGLMTQAVAAVRDGSTT